MQKRSSAINDDPRAVRSREALRRAFLQLLEKRPLDRITIRDIAARAQVGYTTFFRHHATKESLLADVAAAQIQQLMRLTLPLSDSNDLRAASIALFTYVDQHRAVWVTLLTGGAAGAIRTAFLSESRKAAAARARPGGWLRADLAVVLIVGGTLELLAWWLAQKKPVPIAEVAEIHDRIVASPPIAAASGRQQPVRSARRSRTKS